MIIDRKKLQRILRKIEIKLYHTRIVNYIFIYIAKKYAFPLFVNLVEKLKPIITDGYLLDIGTAHGILPRQFAKHCPGLKLITGIDISETSPKLAQKKTNSNTPISFIRADAHHLCFKQNTFDYIVSTGSLNLWEHPTAVLNEAYRILKPNGKCWILDICLVRSLNEIKSGLFQYKLFGVGMVSYSIEEIETFLKESLFTNYKVTTENYSITIELNK